MLTLQADMTQQVHSTQFAWSQKKKTGITWQRKQKL